MTWTFHAEGHVGENARLHERELVKKLHELLVDPRYGRFSSHFDGAEVHAEVLPDGQASIDESVAQEPQRMDPPELQEVGGSTLNPAKDPVIDTNAITPLDAGPSVVAEDDAEGADGDVSK